MLCFGQPARVADIPVEGITRIDRVDFAYAHRLNHTIRLIAAARRHKAGRLEIFVRPMIISQRAQLASVLGAANGILLVGNKGGNTMITGRGAGGEATAVAVLSDVVEIGRAMAAGGGSTTPLGYTTWHPARATPSGENVIAAYLRLVVRGQPGLLARVFAVLSRDRINIGSVLPEIGRAAGRGRG